MSAENPETPPRRKPDPERERLLRLAALLPDRPAFGRWRLRPFSLWTLDLCEMIGLDVFLRLPDGVPPAGGRAFQMAALVWFHDEARPEAAIDAALMRGTWRPEVSALMREAELPAAVAEMADYLAVFSRMIGAATVRVKARPQRPGEKPEKEPAALVEPGATFALIWAIAGGQIVGREQEAYLYRGMPLPKLLGYYHCALRASLAWTVPAGKGRGRKVDPAKIRAAAAAREAMAAPATGDGVPLDFTF